MQRRILVLLIAAALLLPLNAHALDRAQLRAAWQQCLDARTDAPPYLETPQPAAFFAGSTTDSAQQDALNCLNFLRAVAGLDAVALDPLYTLRAQNGALLLAANDFLDHNAPRPEGMPDAQYETAHMGTSLGNIAKFNWMKNDILVDGVRYFARDDGESNLAVMGHRRWLLNPYMSKTGFGLANAQSGMSYVTMYAVDEGNADAQWENVAWPAAGAFPVEMMRAELAWSVSLNESIYDLASSRPQVHMREENSGKEFFFDIARADGDGDCFLSTERCGAGSCIIFRPDIEHAGIDEYVQNQIWTVEITGLRRFDEGADSIRYVCEMTSLYPQDAVNVEISHPEATLAPGETLLLQADVIPSYADDLSILWGSSNPAVASVNPQGRVTAISPGECEITAMSANGRKDMCTLTVE